MWKCSGLVWSYELRNSISWPNFLYAMNSNCNNVDFMVGDCFECRYIAVKNPENSRGELLVVDEAQQPNVSDRLCALEHQDTILHVGYSKDGQRMYYYDEGEGLKVTKGKGYFIVADSNLARMSWKVLECAAKHFKVFMTGFKEYLIPLTPKEWFPFIYMATNCGTLWPEVNKIDTIFVRGFSRIFKDVRGSFGHANADIPIDWHQFRCQYLEARSQMNLYKQPDLSTDVEGL